MAQQVNLCLPVLRQQKRRFAAHTLALSLLAVLAVGGALGGAWIYTLNQATSTLKNSLDAQTKELDALRAAIDQRAKSTAPAEQALQQEITTRRAALQQRDSVLAALSQGLFEPGQGHAARLQLVAQSIPPDVWVTKIRADAQLLEISGFTLEPAALNDWVGQLGGSPLLHGQTLSTIKVESTRLDVGLLSWRPMTLAASAAVAAPPPVWSFTLLSSAAPSAVPASGAKP
jgi:Tfp pilus assembly protein PilN